MLAHDKFRCYGTGCDRRETCQRYTDLNFGPQTLFFLVIDPARCGDHIPVVSSLDAPVASSTPAGSDVGRGLSLET